jgi:hypothetical protein
MKMIENRINITIKNYKEYFYVKILLRQCRFVLGKRGGSFLQCSIKQSSMDFLCFGAFFGEWICKQTLN